MTPRLLLLAIVALGLALLPAAASARGFSKGVASAEIKSTSALVWTRADRPGRLTLQVSRDRRLRNPFISAGVQVSEGADNTIQVRVRKLRPNTRYHFRFTRPGGRSARGSFRTAPGSNSRRTVKFAWTGDSDPVREPGSGRLAFRPFGVFNQMRREGNDFNVNLGDTIYSDTDSQYEFVDPLALTIAAKRAKYRTMLGVASLRKLRAGAGMYNHWDDHEFLNDFAIDQTNYPTASGTQPGQPARVQVVNGRTLYNAGATAFRNYMPVTYSDARGIYRSFRWGKNLELFFLDERSFRDAGADEGGVCDNPPGSGTRDFAPTAPQRIRSLFAAVVPALGTPPPPACLARIKDPSRDFLGAGQYARFTNAIKRSKATFKVIMNELPIQQFYADPYDRWEGYEAERKRLVGFLRDNVKNVVFLTADVHANLVNDVRLQTLEEGGPQNSGILEVTTGPAGTDSFRDDLNDETNNPQTGDLANQFFFTRQPPDGPGIRCSNLDVFSYGQVKVTRRALTIALRDANGDAVQGADGERCGPYVVKRR